MHLVLAPDRVSHRYCLGRKDVCSAVMTSSKTHAFIIPMVHWILCPSLAIAFLIAKNGRRWRGTYIFEVLSQDGGRAKFAKSPTPHLSNDSICSQIHPDRQYLSCETGIFLTPLHERYFISIKQEDIDQYNAASCANIYAELCVCECWIRTKAENWRRGVLRIPVSSAWECILAKMWTICKFIFGPPMSAFMVRQHYRQVNSQQC
jgi:hypothetical protein